MPMSEALAQRLLPALPRIAEEFGTPFHIYDEALGDPERGIAPGTRWEDVPEDWCCPDCGATKGDYAPL